MFQSIIGGFVQVAPDNLQRCTLNKCQKDITIVQAIVEKSTQLVKICKLQLQKQMALLNQARLLLIQHKGCSFNLLTDWMDKDNIELERSRKYVF